MALNILSLPAMSSDPEHAFSAAKITLSNRQNKIGIQIIKYLKCLKSWIGPIEWELKVKDIKIQQNTILRGPDVEKAIKNVIKAIL